jgi:hypothetical protein
MDGVSIRHAEPAELDESSVPSSETINALYEWWDRWETLPATELDRPAAEVLAEERNRDEPVPVLYVLDASAGVDVLERTPEGQAVATVLRAQGDEEEPELWTVEHFHVD